MPLTIRFRGEVPEGDPFEGLDGIAREAPYPVAAALSRVASERDPARRFMLLLKDLLDAVLRYAGLVAASDYLANRSPPSDKVNAALAELVRRGPREGKWIELLRECASACGAASAVPELGAFLRDAELDRRSRVRVSFPEAGVESDWSGGLSAWVAVRNKLLGHGGTPSEFGQINAEVGRLALSVLDAMRPLLLLRLVRREVPGEPVVLTGPDPGKFPPYSGPTLRAEILLTDEAHERELELHPLLVSAAAEGALPQVETDSVLLYDRLRSRTVVYRNESMAPRPRPDKFDALRAAFAERGVDLCPPEMEVRTFEDLQIASRAQVDAGLRRETDGRRYDPTTYLARERVERHLNTFSEGPAEVLFTVGESGCGKSNVLLRFAAERSAAGDVVVVARASTLREEGLPSLTELEEALRRRMGVTAGLGTWLELTVEANAGKPPAGRRNVLLIVDQLDSFMGQGRTPAGLFLRLLELLGRHEESRCLKILTAIRRESAEHILAETGPEPPLGSARHYRPGDEETGPAHPSWFLTVGPLDDAEAGQLLDSLTRARGLAPVRFEELSKPWQRVLRIPYAIRRYAEAAELLGGPPRFRASLHKLEDLLHAAREERRQEMLVQLMRYCAEHHVVDPSVDEILEAGGPLAEAVLEAEEGSDYDWLRRNGLVREDTVRLEDGTTRLRVTFSHDRVFDASFRVYELARAKDTRLEAARFLLHMVALGVVACAFVGGLAAFLSGRDLKPLGRYVGPEASLIIREASSRMAVSMTLAMVKATSLVVLCTAAMSYVAFRLLAHSNHLLHRILALPPRERLEDLRIDAGVRRHWRECRSGLRLSLPAVIGAIPVAVVFGPTAHTFGLYLAITVALMTPVAFVTAARATAEWVRGRPLGEWRLCARLLFGRSSYARQLLGFLVLCLVLAASALALPTLGAGADGVVVQMAEDLRDTWRDAKEALERVPEKEDKREELALLVAQAGRKARRTYATGRMSSTMAELAPYLLLCAVLTGCAGTASTILVYRPRERSLLAELAGRRARAGSADS